MTINEINILLVAKIIFYNYYYCLECPHVITCSTKRRKGREIIEIGEEGGRRERKNEQEELGIREDFYFYGRLIPLWIFQILYYENCNFKQGNWLPLKQQQKWFGSHGNLTEQTEWSKTKILPNHPLFQFIHKYIFR